MASITKQNIMLYYNTNISMCVYIYIYIYYVVKMFVPETDVNVAVVACRFMWQEETRPADT